MELELRGVSKYFEDFTAVENVSFSIKKGELFSLLGPSGCGKTTTLRMIAGFYAPDIGGIYLKGKEITHQPLDRRGTAMVFQNYALFPHMTVFENIAFGLKMQKLDKSSIAKRVQDVLNLIQLPHIETKYPRELSGGMQQRVAIARAIVIHPEVLLLDEPLSNLDAKLREELRMDIRKIQQKIGITTVFVTHDISEAFAMSDRIAVMQNGKVMQIGSPREIYEQPVNEFVGAFVGKSNRFSVQIDDITGDIAIAGNESLQMRLRVKQLPVARGDVLAVMVRPERISLIETPSSRAGRNVHQGTVLHTYYLGNQNHYEVMVNNCKFTVEMANNGSRIFEQGEKCYIEWGIEDSVYFNNANRDC
ncbi:ABC transporter ATP-binding protein|uniref:Spermidine/putrescine import ATP-binding protein PotA n=1 Tax=Dendrosporobacter quercicolus TaxID=146817 RepID=A0A1G9SM91_9FIRM|nr:ABC transporter ATP-binding protein [Dendrosporobacter quercicolus]NSL48672.1 ABC transporter ATP-binding protein [Dendrosporobacter quercicolus DSM 1736]SDM36586.1 putative spermidine/putrescine transport system ATP-binding protein [Dendrosporobacter quercicolus]